MNRTYSVARYWIGNRDRRLACRVVSDSVDERLLARRSERGALRRENLPES